MTAVLTLLPSSRELRAARWISEEDLVVLFFLHVVLEFIVDRSPVENLPRSSALIGCSRKINGAAIDCYSDIVESPSSSVLSTSGTNYSLGRPLLRITLADATARRILTFNLRILNTYSRYSLTRQCC